MKKYWMVLVMVLFVFCLTGCGSNAGAEDYNKGVAAMKAANYQQASESFSKAVAANSENTSYHISYGMSLLQLEKYSEAYQSFQKAIVTGTEKEDLQNNKRAYRGMGMACYNQQQYDKAIENLNAALAISELSDLNFDSYLYLGSSYAVQKESQKAYDAYANALKIDNKSLAAYMGEYQALIDLDSKSEAKKLLKEALLNQPTTDEDQFIYAKLQFYNKKYKAAEATLTSVADTGNAEAYLFLGQIDVSNCKFLSAIEHFETYIEKTNDTKNLLVCNQMAICYIEKFEYKKAKKWVDMADEIEGTDIELQSIRYNQVLVYDKLAKYKKAYALAKKYAKVYPEDKGFSDEAKYLKTFVED